MHTVATATLTHTHSNEERSIPGGTRCMFGWPLNLRYFPKHQIILRMYRGTSSSTTLVHILDHVIFGDRESSDTNWSTGSPSPNSGVALGV